MKSTDNPPRPYLISVTKRFLGLANRIAQHFSHHTSPNEGIAHVRFPGIVFTPRVLRIEGWSGESIVTLVKFPLGLTPKYLYQLMKLTEGSKMATQLPGLLKLPLRAKQLPRDSDTLAVVPSTEWVRVLMEVGKKGFFSRVKNSESSGDPDPLSWDYSIISQEHFSIRLHLHTA